MRKKGSVAALTAMVLAASLSACGGGSSSTDANGKVTLTYGIWDKNQEPAMQKIIKQFEAKNPNISVQVQLTPYDGNAYFTKLQAAATGGTAPDVFWMNGPNFQLYAQNGIIKPLTGLKVDTSDYPKALVDLYSYKGQQYGLPKDMDTVGLWYNKKLFDAAGVKYPTASWTWSDFEAAAAKLSDPAKGVYGVSASLTGGQENWYDTVFQAGGQIISKDGKKSLYDDPKTLQGLKIWTDLIARKDSPTVQQMTDVLPINLFESGKTAMYWGGSWDSIEFEQNTSTKGSVDVAPLPKGAQRATVIHGLANVVYSKSKHPEQAEKFAAFLGSKQAALTEADTGTVIPAFNDTQQSWVKAHPDFHVQNFLDEVPYSVPLPVSADTAAWNTLELNILTKAYSGKEPLGKAAKDLATQMSADLAKERH
jgi:multiple sugar transport system substrate-binding protein